MFLNFIGSGSALNTALGNNSAFIKAGDSILLLDCGSTTFSQIQNLNLLENIKSIYVLLTHRHPDHISSLGDLIFYNRYILKAEITVLTPDAENMSKLLSFMGVDTELYNMLKLKQPYMLKNNDFQIEIKAVPVEHVEDMDCFGYILVYNGTKIYYSGDAKDIPSDILESFVAGEIECMYQDVCSYDNPDGPHLYIERLKQLIKPEDRDRVFCMHYDESFDAEQLIQAGFRQVRNFVK